jgi:PAS domain-containing protein
MNRLAIQFLDEGFHRVLFDAIPIPVFVVDSDVSILEYNVAAAQLVGSEKQAVIRRRGGEILRCLHAAEVPEGCGHSPACSNCVVRKSVQAASRGERVTRQLARMELVRGRRTTKVNLRVSCIPFTYQQRTFILLILEGLND